MRTFWNLLKSAEVQDYTSAEGSGVGLEVGVKHTCLQHMYDVVAQSVPD